jgi:anti-sigma factor RsiW
VTQKSVNVGRLRRYLLGSLSEEEAAELESLYFASDEVFEDLLAEEDDLVDAYVADELPPDERSRFDRLLPVSSRLRNRVETARALGRQKRPSRRALPVRALLLAATVILILGVVWAVRKPRPSSEMAAHATPVPTAAAPAVVAAIPVPVRGGPRRVFSYMLVAGLTRDVSGATMVAVPSGIETVELRLPLEADAFSSYDVQLRTEGGRDVFERRGLRSRKEYSGAVVAVEVPAETLHSGAYILTLRGHPGRGAIETLDQYSFRVSDR